MIAILPEELIERILLSALPVPAQPRPHWLRSPHNTDTRLAPLLACRTLNRIATPLLYQSVSLPSPAAASLFLRTLQCRPELSGHVRALAVGGTWRPARDILRMCHGLRMLDLCICFEGDADEDALAEASPFGNLKAVQHLTIRKPANVYLSLARPRALINSLANAIGSWSDLRTADIAFKLSDDTPTSPVSGPAFVPFALPTLSSTPSTPSSAGPVTALATALANSTSLHTFSTQLPSVWNTAIATIATNRRLERIILSPPNHATSSPPFHNYHPSSPSDVHATPAISGTGLFLMEARRHPRLAELIGAGTPIIRSRAQTLGTQRSPPTPTSTSSASSSSSSSLPSQSANVTKRETVGLGLRIDTSTAVIASGTPTPTTLGSYRCRSPGASTPGSRSAVSVGGGPVNPAWMGPPAKRPGARKGRA
ncbi:hypothetical protein H0H87_007730 [Tephrocybe sp. NHM501043]|nr:hypothetical protein H0H87_007730 [Tephrocybe sp. NHM501043]